jgi:hypothetical protein
MHEIINSITSIPESNTLLFLGGGLILAALFLRRVVSVFAYSSQNQAKSVNTAKHASAK